MIEAIQNNVKVVLERDKDSEFMCFTIYYNDRPFRGGEGVTHCRYDMGEEYIQTIANSILNTVYSMVLLGNVSVVERICKSFENLT